MITFATRLCVFARDRLVNKLKDKSFYNANYSTVSKKRSSKLGGQE